MSHLQQEVFDPHETFLDWLHGGYKGRRYSTTGRLLLSRHFWHSVQWCHRKCLRCERVFRSSDLAEKARGNIRLPRRVTAVFRQFVRKLLNMVEPGGDFVEDR